MTSIPIIDASFAHLFVSYLGLANYPVQDWLAEECLPLSLIKPVEGYVSEYHLRKFITDAADRTGISDLGLKVAETVSMRELGKLADEIAAAPTLYAGIDLFCRHVGDVNSHATFWLGRHDGQVWFFRANPNELDIGQQFAEQFTVLYMIKIVQLIAGQDWHPTHVWLKATDSRSYIRHPAFKHSELACSRGLSGVMLPEIDDVIAIPRRLDPPVPSPASLCETLQILLRLYLPEKFPPIELAAELSRLSVRTFKRRLAEDGMTYRKLLQQMRFELACSMLKDTQKSILEVANLVAYTHHGNFSRAFQKWSGMTPQAYRELHRES